MRHFWSDPLHFSPMVKKKKRLHKNFIFNVSLSNLSCIQKKNEEKWILYAKDIAVFLRGELQIANVDGLHTFIFG